MLHSGSQEIKFEAYCYEDDSGGLGVEIQRFNEAGWDWVSKVAQ